MKQVKYELSVFGRTWGGASCDCSYPLPNDPDGHPKTLEEAARIAGDFVTLSSADITKVTTEIEVETQPLYNAVNKS